MKAIIILLLSVFSQVTFAQQKVNVFTSGQEGHKIYRIPAIVSVSKDNLLAFCEGRVNNAGDFGDINIVMKRSDDGGKTWSALKTIVDYTNLQAGNPAPVVDYTDPEFPKGRLFLFYNTGNNHESEVRKGNGLREVWYITSTDQGNTWGAPVNITHFVHKPNQPQINPAYHFKEDWRSYANTPGHAIQFKSGKYKGRIYVAANHSAKEPLPDFSDYRAHGFYSDDHGKTFHVSENISLPGSNEAMATELNHDLLMMNIRNQRGDQHFRIVAQSKDGGTTWDTTYVDKQLPDPVCQASIITLNKQKNYIAFCNAANTNRRDDLTLRISKDGGKSWSYQWLVDKSGDDTGSDFTAYSDLVVLDNKTIGILYERNNYQQIVFTAHHWR